MTMTFHNLSKGEFIITSCLLENKSCIFSCRSWEGNPQVVPLLIPVNLRTCLWGSLRLCPSHLEPFNHQCCSEEHQYSPTITEPTRCLSHWQDNVLLSIAVIVKVLTQSIQDACSGAVLLRAQRSPTQCSCYGAPRGFAVEFMCPLL